MIENDYTIAVLSQNKGFFLVYFDNGKDLKKNDMSGLKKEEILEKFKPEFESQFSQYSSEKPDVDVYDTGNAKWISVIINNPPISFYTTNNKGQAVTILSSSLGYSKKDIENIIDTFNFGSPSFFTVLKNIARSISDFGFNIMGVYGSYIAWTVVIGVLFTLIAMICSIFKKRR